jgi:hypothetical protein
MDRSRIYTHISLLLLLTMLFVSFLAYAIVDIYAATFNSREFSRDKRTHRNFYSTHAPYDEIQNSHSIAIIVLPHPQERQVLLLFGACQALCLFLLTLISNRSFRSEKVQIVTSRQQHLQVYNYFPRRPSFFDPFIHSPHPMPISP